MKSIFSKLIAISVCVLMLLCSTVIADTSEGLTVSEGDISGNAAIEFDSVPADSENDVTSDAEITSDSDEAVTSDSVITSDAEITSDADVTSDAETSSDATTEPPETPSTGNTGSTGSTGSSSPAVPETEEEVTSDSENPEEDMALNFTDLAADDWAYSSILNLVQRGIVSGDTAGTVRPDGGVTREEVAKMMVVARKYALAENPEINANDSESVAEWAKAYFATAMEKGIIAGYTDGTVRGNGVVNRAEMATIIVRSINASTDSFSASSFTDITADDWYAKYVECAKTLGIVNGYEDGSFGGENEVTRREAFAMIDRMVRLLEALEA